MMQFVKARLRNSALAYWVSSIGRCNTGLLERVYLFGKDFRWGLPTEDLAGPVVEGEGDRFESSNSFSHARSSISSGFS